MTIVEALKKLVLAFGGTKSSGTTIVEVLKDVNTAIGGTSTAKTTSEAIAEVAESVEDNIVVPTGKIDITSTAEVDVTDYASAQVVDADLIATNIKKDVNILGVTGSYEGGTDLDVVLQTIEMQSFTMTAEYSENAGYYLGRVKIATLNNAVLTPIPYGEDYAYTILWRTTGGVIRIGSSYKEIDGVALSFAIEPEDWDAVDPVADTLFLYGQNLEGTQFTVSVPADTIEAYRATEDVADVIGWNPPIEPVQTGGDQTVI